MAELLVPKVIDVLGNVVVKQLGEKVNLVMGVEEEVANIKKSLETIQEVLHDAERRRVKERPVGKWLEKLEDITYEMDDVLDEWNVKILKPENEGTYRNARVQPTLGNKVRSFIPSLCSCLKQLPVCSDIASKIKKINEELELTFEKACQFEFISSSGIPDSQDFQRIMTTSIIDESEIYDGVQVISVVGVGGSGKTTLAQLHIGSFRPKKDRKSHLWRPIADKYTIDLHTILESAGKSSHDMLELDSLIRLIKETFSGKRFLLVLDDVWTEDDSKWKPFQYSLKDGLLGDSICWKIRGLMQEGGKHWAENCKKIQGVATCCEDYGKLVTVQRYRTTMAECFG
ncbi:unnamed protein product [Coffea canephora]|uniref:DH200=94 genomic scaffold, scaffold_2668 n=1 Tax=Coffea canephora TaxID=49390 RepID=A0A068VK50_COFCA|nr:unnamed protein product [Coffea canephora]